MSLRGEAYQISFILQNFLQVVWLYVIFQNGVFRIPYVRKSDEAQYVCKASNSGGSSEIRTILYVSGG